MEGMDRHVVLVNGEIGRKITCRKGFRQGNPLWPLLFALVVDLLSMMLCKASDRLLIKSLPVCANNEFINL